MTSTIKERLSDFTPHLCLAVALSASTAFTSGYDLAWWGAIIAQPYFNAIFGEAQFITVTGIPYASLSSTQQSIGTVSSAIGVIIGACLAGVILPRTGFRLTSVTSALWMLGGSLIQITTGVGGYRYWQLVGGKIVVCVGVGINSVAIPLYLAQCTTGRARGTTLNSFGFIVAFGGLVASLVGLGVSKKLSDIVWLLPIGLQFVNPVIAIAAYPWMPESPQWLMSRGRETEAQRTLSRLRSHLSDIEVEKEVEELRVSLLEKANNKNSSIAACFRGTDLKRTLTLFGVASLAAAQGLAFLLSYLATLFYQLGIQNIFLILVIVYLLATVLTCAGFLYQDTLGRRPALITGSVVMACCMLVFSAIATAYRTLQGGSAQACVVMIMIWFIAYTLTWNATLATVLAELPAHPAREASLAMAQMCNGAVSAIVVVVSPYLQNPTDANLGAKIGYIYGAMSVISVVFLWFLLPECKGRTLAQLDWLYEHQIPVRQMGKYPIPDLVNVGSTSAARSNEIPNNTESKKEEVELLEFAA